MSALAEANGIHAAWAAAAVNVALRAGARSKTLKALNLAARLHPQAISDKIAVLEKQIALLRSHLPKEATNG